MIKTPDGDHWMSKTPDGEHWMIKTPESKWQGFHEFNCLAVLIYTTEWISSFDNHQ